MSPRCPECGKVVDLSEYVQMSAELIRNGTPTPLGVEMYCTDCWYEINEDKDGQAKKDGS
jgi:hypothetical protein